MPVIRTTERGETQATAPAALGAPMAQVALTRETPAPRVRAQVAPEVLPEQAAAVAERAARRATRDLVFDRGQKRNQPAAKRCAETGYATLVCRHDSAAIPVLSALRVPGK
jgi:hypothetical protein